MLKRLLVALAPFGVAMAVASVPAHAQADPLASWIDGAAKARIVAFVKSTTEQGGSDYVAPADRIAVFDNDGTLWCEQPMYVQFAFAIDRVKALAPKHPEWKTKQPFKAVARRRPEGACGRRRARPRRADDGDARRHDHRRVRADRRATGSTTARHPTLQPPLHRARLPADAANCSPTCGRTASRRTSSPAAASSSCGRGPSASTASRPSR